MAHRIPVIKAFTLTLLIAILFELAGGLTIAQAGTLKRQQRTLTPQISYAIHHDLSPALRDIQPAALGSPGVDVEPPNQTLPKALRTLPVGSASQDPVLQSKVDQKSRLNNMPATQFNFEGIHNVNKVLPPDTVGDVSANYYVQWVNLSIAIWQLDRSAHTATQVYGPTSGNAIWSGFGGACQTSNDGDPIVLYDHLADRWMISQFALPNFPNGPFYECIAVSQSGDPTGAWYRYAFLASATKMNDYPHLGVWPDGYYMTANQFDSNNAWAGAGVWAFERDKMLQGLPAQQVYFDLATVNNNYGGMLPADLDGSPPTTGTPEYFAEVDDSTWLGPSDALRIWEFHVDWTDPASSSFGISGDPNKILPVASFTPLCTNTHTCIPQPGTAQRVDAIGDRLMHRLQFRSFNGYVTLVANHTVDAGGGQAGIRWYELRRDGSGWHIYQQGTYAGDGANSENRWMASAAMDYDGNIAIGYSVSSSSVYPSVRYAGRLASDPLGTLLQGEATLIAGGGSQLHNSGRWGDYSSMSVDPSDDCTFWYTQEYYQTSSSSGWQTRIGSFTFPTCLAKGYLRGTVTDASNYQPVQGAMVVAGADHTLTDINGFYQLQLPVGTYTETVSAYGYQPASASNISIKVNTTTTRDFTLTPKPLVHVSGIVTDGSGQDWPLYARIDITAAGYARSIFTNPTTGAYDVQLEPGLAHSFAVSAVSPGYSPQNQSITPSAGGFTQNFALAVDSTCTAPGYANTGTCTPQSGGLVVGNVYDLNTGNAVNGATVASSGAPATSTPTPDDPAVNDGFYTFFSSLTGARQFTASAPHYGNDLKSVDVMAHASVALDFSLPAGLIEANPASFSVTITTKTSLTRTLTLSNTGTLTATFTLTGTNPGTTPWLTVAPITGTLPAAGQQSIQLTLDASATSASINLANIQVVNDTPYGPLAIPITLNLSHRIYLPFISR